jgi:polyisoprenyl-teichoic acid--peptidoglycan teichoic acid transferase
MSQSSLASSQPVRFPDVGSRPVMTRRAWVLVVLNILIPGSAQLLAGNRRLGRFGVGATFVLWALVIAAGLTYLFARATILTIASMSTGLIAIAVVLAFYAALWLILTLDTLRLVRLVRAAPSARGWVAGLATVLLVATSGTAGYGAFVATTASNLVSNIFITAPPKPAIDGRYNIMLLGGDSGPDREGLRPDSITVVSIDEATGAATMIGLPRNMAYVPFAEGSPLAAEYPDGYGADVGCEVSVCMLNSVYTEVELVSPDMYPDAVAQGSAPGIEGMRDAVEGITGLTIQYYALIDMQGFLDLVDSLGGIDVDVATAVPIHTDETFTTVAEWIGPGKVHLDGYHALWYARSRHDTTDYDRMARQRQLEEALLEQFTPVNVLGKLQAVAAAGTRVVKTDIPQASLGYFVDLASKTKNLPLQSVELVPDNGVDPEDPDFDYIRELVAAGVAPPPTADSTGG